MPAEPTPFSRSTRMLRTALGPHIGGYLEDPDIVEVMLNPDGRLWIDRLSSGLEDTGERIPVADGERIVRLVAHHVGAEAHGDARESRQSCPRRGSASRGCCRLSSRPRPSRSGNRRSRCLRSTIMSPPAS
jgi:type IV secretion system protein TrbB